MSPLEAGQLVDGRYSLVARIGSGGLADVWYAEDQIADRPVALKFLHERFAQDRRFVDRFRREARAAVGMQHPNIVGVYDCGESDGRHWIAIEYVEGASLKDLIERGLEVGEAVEIVRQILAGVRFAHEHGIAHRDLKPLNVLASGGGPARVADFGIARPDTSAITQPESPPASAQYLSPEQAGGKEATAASDLYSIGVILYETLTGQVPFEAETPGAVAQKQVSERPRRPSELNRAVTPALDAVVLRALAKQPENRFASADEFLRGLDAAERDPRGEALGDTAAYAPSAWLTRRRAIALAAPALIAAGIAVFALTRSDGVPVPAVIEKQLPDARAALERKGFEVKTSIREACAKPKTVTEQDPPAGAQVDEGSTVALTVSLGEDVTVPPTANLSAAKAMTKLKRQELRVDTREQTSRNVGSGKVIGTDPAAGESVDCESPVTVLVSSGWNLIDLPSVLGEQRSAAEAELERLGFIINVETRDADAAEGTVIGQDPKPGSRVKRGASVTITISTRTGPPRRFASDQVEVPLTA